MTPGSFDPVTSRAMVGDDRARILEAKAREDADKGIDAYDPPAYPEGGSYWSEVSAEFDRRVYTEQFMKRLQRNERKSQAPAHTPTDKHGSNKQQAKKGKENGSRDPQGT